jgi:16S rRNA (cytosine967-C5)-methyltransferase
MIKHCYQILYKIFADGAYVNIALNNGLKSVSPNDKNIITRIVYGVTEKNIFLEYAIDKLVKKRPHVSDTVILKMGIYRIYFMNEPDYAVVNTMVELAKSLKRSPAFINAVLRKCRKIEMPSEEYEKKSLEYNVPIWAIKEIEKDFGQEITEQFFIHPKELLTHIRHNPKKISQNDFEQYLNFEFDRKTPYGYYVCHNTLTKLKEHTHLYTVQSLGSMAVCNAIGVAKGNKVLDVCAAPGGKSIYLKQLADISITSCDIHPHRLELINSYKKRMDENDIKVVKNDAVVFNPKWEGQFDAVLCDVPCSGLGVLNSRTDIFQHRTKDSIKELTDLQDKIIQTSSKYVKKGGCLVYSTCTILKQENEQIVNKFLANNTHFKPIDFDIKVKSLKLNNNFVQLMPYISDTEGFFIAKVKYETTVN